MESVTPRPGGALHGRGRELAVLAAGLAAGAALAWAGLTVQDGLRTAGEVAVTRLSSAVADTVVAEWERMLRGTEAPVPPAGERFYWSGREKPKLEPITLRDVRADPDRLSVFETLLAEAERRELVQQDPAGALELVLEALEKEPGALRRSEGWLRALQLGVKLGGQETADTYWEELRTLDLSQAREGIPYRILAWLALPNERRIREPKPATTTELGWLYVEDDRLELGTADDPTPHFELAPMLEVIGRRLASGPIAFQVMQRMVRKLAQLAPLPLTPDDGRWHLVQLAGLPFATRVSGVDTHGFFYSPAALERSLVERAALPAGFALDFSGEGEALGTAVRPRKELPGSALAFTLRHADPAALGRSESSRLRLLRAALFVLAATCVAGGLLTARVLVRQRKLAELKSAFIAGVSHDLRTPLASILLVAENLETGVVVGEDRERYHRALRKEATRLRRLVDDVLDFSRLERGAAPRIEREGVDLASFTSELEAEFRARVEGEERPFLFERGPLPELASLDAHAVRRALENLLDNALKHGEGTVRLACAASDGRLRFRVTDEGPGVPAAERERVFEPFERLDARNGANGHAGGAGLGLAIVRSIARGHGGEARVLDGPASGGAVFELELPLEEVPA